MAAGPTQIAAPSKEFAPVRVTVRFVNANLNELAPPSTLALLTQGGSPAGAVGTVKFTWYRPTKPGVSPAKAGAAIGGGFPVEGS